MTNKFVVVVNKLIKFTVPNLLSISFLKNTTKLTCTAVKQHTGMGQKCHTSNKKKQRVFVVSLSNKQYTAKVAKT